MKRRRKPLVASGATTRVRPITRVALLVVSIVWKDDETSGEMLTERVEDYSRFQNQDV